MRKDNAHSDDTNDTSSDRVTSYVYDLLGRLIGVTDPEGIQWAYTYDVYGNRITADDPGLGLWTMEYDANGNLTLQTDAKGQTIAFEYDPLNRVTLKRVGPWDTRVDTRYVYDEVRSGYYNVGQVTTQKVWTALDGYYDRVLSDYYKNGKVQHRSYVFNGKTYQIQYSYSLTGDVRDQRLPYSPGSTALKWIGQFDYDAANRLTEFGGYITGASYNLYGSLTGITFGNGAVGNNAYSTQRGWPNLMETYDSGGAKIVKTRYTRSASGRISSVYTEYKQGRFNYSYDYAGRLLVAANSAGVTSYDQSFTYDRAGRMRSNSQLGTYNYTGAKPAHAPKSLTPTSGAAQTFSYDANGNMLAGLDGKAMTYDGENRPLSVTYLGTTTSYVYGADGTRRKKIVTSGTGTTTTTVYFGPVEIRDFGGAGETVITYPHPNVRLVNGQPSYIHHDALASVRGITGGDGLKDARSIYRPYGEQVTWTHDATATAETKGFIGERYDEDAGLQYLNARYYDPKLALFIQPDWFEVTAAGVGTNRYSYSLGDPVNMGDPGGNVTNSDAAYMSQDVYYGDDDQRAGERLPDHLHRMTAEEREKRFPGAMWEDERTGFRAGAYKNLNTKEITIAFAGTAGLRDAGLRDWGNNVLQQVIGAAPQFRQARDLAAIVSKSVENRRDALSFTGHSLGGGLALFAASSLPTSMRRVNLHRNAVAFNPAGLKTFTSSLPSRVWDWAIGGNIHIHSNIVGLEPLSVLNAFFMNSLPGSKSYYMGKFPNSVESYFERHSMQAFRGVLPDGDF